MIEETEYRWPQFIICICMYTPIQDNTIVIKLAVRLCVSLLLIGVYAAALFLCLLLKYNTLDQAF